MKKPQALLLTIFLMLITGCQVINPTPAPSPTPQNTATPSLTPPPTATVTPQPSATPTVYLSPTPQQKTYQAGESIIAPILLYHHVSEDNSDNIRYTITTGQFKEQLDTLKNLGYTSIPLSRLIDVIHNGGSLPLRPVVITFDDGAIDGYEVAYPMMKSMGMSGVMYLVANRLEAKGFISAAQMQEMAADGWEVGSHSMTHVSLSNAPSLSYEMLESRNLLEEKLGLPVQSIAYPFGVADEFIKRKAKSYGYEAAMGLGRSYEQSKDSLFFLSRIEIQHGTTLEQFINSLPWKTPDGQ
ncbi:MAG: polysaccharide deacetylase family protein [Anaerolineae bacterium]|nr:polysaccharide deacetylase family protein [Anaerolineae bacterium]